MTSSHSTMYNTDTERHYTSHNYQRHKVILQFKTLTPNDIRQVITTKDINGILQFITLTLKKIYKL